MLKHNKITSCLKKKKNSWYFDISRFLTLFVHSVATIYQISWVNQDSIELSKN